ncbi:MAG: hypothetical protein ACK56I_09125, partial [bacterium]
TKLINIWYKEIEPVKHHPYSAKYFVLWMFRMTRIKSMCAGMATHDFTLGSGTEELSLDTCNRVKHFTNSYTSDNFVCPLM